MLLVNKPDFVLEADRRVVKVTDVATVRSATEIIAAAEAEAARIREEAKAAFEAEKQRGYEKGLSDGKMEIACDGKSFTVTRTLGKKKMTLAVSLAENEPQFEIR